MLKNGVFTRFLALLLTLLMASGFVPAGAPAFGAADSVTLTITHETSGDILDRADVSILPGDTVLKAILRALDDENIPYVASNGYLSSVGGVAGEGWDGWSFSVNGIIPSVGMGSIYVKPGDVLKMQYLSFGDNGELGTQGSLNGDVEGFSFDVGRLSSQTTDWGGGYVSTTLTLVLPHGSTMVQVTGVPGGAGADIYRERSDTAYAVGDSIPIVDGDTLRVFVGGCDEVYEINIRLLTGDFRDLLEYTAGSLTGATGEWQVIAMSAYRRYNPSTPFITGEQARLSYINYAVAVVGDYTKSAGGVRANPDSEYAKAILALQSLGINPGRLYPVNSMSPLNAFEKLRSVADTDMASLQYASTSPYILHAFRQQGSYDFSAQEEKVLRFLLQTQDAGGAWGFDLDGFNADVDATASVITSLAPYVRAGNRPDIAEAVAKAVKWLATKQNSDGTVNAADWGGGEPNANSTAVTIIAMCALGLDPAGNADFAYNTINGLLSYASPDSDGFLADGAKNERATWDGFLALAAAALYYQKGGAVDVYDFSGVTDLQPGRATGEGAVAKPPTPESTERINVSFTLKGVGGEVWIARRAVSVPSDARVHYLVTTELDKDGFTCEGADYGYIRSITHPSLGELREFQHGPNSGWVYSIQGVLPTVDMISKKLQDGDDVVWYYTSDYTREPGAEEFGGAPAAGAAAGLLPAVTVTVEAVLSKGVAAAKVSDEAIQSAIKDAQSGGLNRVVLDVPKTKEAMSGMNISLAASSVRALADSGLSLTVQSQIAAMTADKATLAGLAAAKDDETVTFSAELADRANGLTPEQRSVAGENPVYALTIRAGQRAADHFGGLVTATMPYLPPAGMAAEDYGLLTVYSLGADGKATEMAGAAYNPATGAVTFTMPHFSLYFIREWLCPFTDVQKGNWYYRTVRRALADGLMVGTAQGVFSPGTSLSRAMIATMLWRLDGAPSAQGAAFTDVRADDWFAGAAAWISARGIDAGMGGGAFLPNDAITREQFAVVLYNYAAAKGRIAGDARGKADYVAAYADADDVSIAAREAMKWANASGLVVGRTLSKLDPGGLLTRAEGAAILQRYGDE